MAGLMFRGSQHLSFAQTVGKGLCPYCQSPNRGSPDPAALCSQGDGLEDIRPIPKPAVDMDSDLAVGRLDTLRQGVDRSRRLIQLPAPVVADHNPIAAVLPRQQHILRREDALDPDLHRGAAPQPGDVHSPGVRVGIESQEALVVRLRGDHLSGLLQHRERQPGRRAKVVPPLVVPHPQHGAVGRQEDRHAPAGLGALDDALLEYPVFHRVELHHVRYGCDFAPGLRHFFHGVVGKG
ncbi:hypothetical protein BP6252_10200 [Coleophoma cylindrospora]|uniref:Uncharacterized protein n=1 Tax=Coleophoma cylindrospora TaxID=1849047 RepID=A0A3D8QXR9_9HELO|nr:hypothetical protein BP6252_10200 [Coleophoma cylindrospora]